MGFYFESKCKKDCFNCGVCELSCPVKAIKMVKNKSDGYLYPEIDSEKCINCGKCKKVCINLNRNRLVNKTKKAYVIKNKNIDVRKRSSSGGISSILMEYVIENNGCVYGVGYDEFLEVVHQRATTIEECENFKTSKYVKSLINESYSKVLKDLKNDRVVLFTGTPCQVAGLKSFIPNKLQEKLILCEIMCDCVASPILYRKFKNFIEKKYKKNIKKINFRSKENGAHNMSMKIIFSDDEEIILPIKEKNEFSDYMQVYGCGLSSPYSCLNCEFEHIDERVSDFTIGDYWGKKEYLRDDNLGLSILLVNTEKAQKIFNDILKNKIEFIEVTPKQALDNNHINHKDIVLNKDNFMKDLSTMEYEQLIDKYVNKYALRTKIARIFPANIKMIIKKIINR